MLSLFVAVILDNLEMDEELKKIKQLKAREEVCYYFNKITIMYYFVIVSNLDFMYANNSSMEASNF